MDESQSKPGEYTIKLSKWRFAVLVISWLVKFLTSFQYVQYIMVSDVLMEFFSVSSYTVSWATTVMSTHYSSRP